MSETYREEQEANTLADRVINDLNKIVGADVFEIEVEIGEDEDKEEHEHDREADQESEYEDDEMIYN